MKFSIFTPTHDTTHLLETYQSLLAQTFTDWEWVIVLNNGAEKPVEIDDERVRTFKCESANGNVGALKKFACERSRGEYLVELDHDDRLVPRALETINEIIERYNSDFLYSDCSQYREDGSFNMFDKIYGWEDYGVHLDGKTYQVNHSFPPDASSLREIYYAPDHVRVWRAETYRAVGGHDPALDICDDFDLVVRTYLSGASFHFIPECLYLYRITGGNTWLKRVDDIGAKQRELSAKYTHPLVHEWCRRNKLLKYDLGGGMGCPEGFIPLDLKNGYDLRLPWTLKTSSVGCIRAYDFLEHIPHCRDSSCTHEPPYCVVGVMNEIYRVLVPGGWLLSATPSTDGRGAFQDPTHCSFWNSNSFWYYTRRQQQQYVPGITARFQRAQLWNAYPTDWHKEHNIMYVYADLVALKGQRQPGLVEI